MAVYEFDVLTEANGIGGFLCPEEQPTSFDEAKAEMRRQAQDMRERVAGGEYILSNPIRYYVVAIYRNGVEIDRIMWTDDNTKKRIAVWDQIRDAQRTKRGRRV